MNTSRQSPVPCGRGQQRQHGARICRGQEAAREAGAGSRDHKRRRAALGPAQPPTHQASKVAPAPAVQLLLQARHCNGVLGAAGHLQDRGAGVGRRGYGQAPSKGTTQHFHG